MVRNLRVQVKQVKVLDTEQGLYSNNVIDITDSITMDVMSGIEMTKDIFQFSVLVKRRPFGDTSTTIEKQEYARRIGLEAESGNEFNIRDMIFIYAFYDAQPDDLDDALIMSGYITELKQDIGVNGPIIKIKGTSLSEFLLKGKVNAFFSKTGENNTVPKMIKQIIRKATRGQDNKNASKLFAFLDNETGLPDGAEGLISSKKSDGTAFPEIGFHKGPRAAYEHIEDLSRPEYTEDEEVGTYIFGIEMKRDSQGKVVNEFFWKPKPTDSTSQLVQGKDITNFKVSKGVGDVVNAHYISAGKDLRGKSVIEIATYGPSIARFGVRMKYYNSNHSFDSIQDKEENEATSQGVVFDEETHYPASPDIQTSSYTFRTIPNRDASGKDIGTFVSVIGSAEYNSAIRTEARILSRRESENVLATLGEATFRLDCDMTLGSNTLVSGNFHDIKSTAIGWIGDDSTKGEPTKKMRLKDQKNRLSGQGWQVTLKFVEDEELLKRRFGEG